MGRRFLLRFLVAAGGAALLLRPLLAAAGWNTAAFSATTEKDALAALFPGEAIGTSDAIRIETHDVVENGAFVPVKIEAALPGVDLISIVVEKNPNPLIAQFELGPRCRGFIATRIKVGEPSDLVAVVRSQGRLFSKRRFVEVVEGGCN
jgi:sulfur-oxidizing protein SoxY